MIWRSPEPRYDVASAIAQGGRPYQEDATVADFPFGMDSGVAVLADGMGGHAAGDVASKIVVTQVYAALKFRSAEFAADEAAIPRIMARATKQANETIRAHVEGHPETHGMGATLVGLVAVENRLYWMSVGDSPLYLMRDGKLSQLNEDHSLAPQIDFMAEQGLITREAAQSHPDRNCLTSVLMGGKIARSDCPADPYEMKMGDVLVISSDGLQYLDEGKIAKLLHRHRRKKAAEIAGHLLKALEDLADPDQDNISFTVVKLNHMRPTERKIVPKPTDFVEEDRLPTTRVAILPTPPSAEEAEDAAEDAPEEEDAAAATAETDDEDKAEDAAKAAPEAEEADAKAEAKAPKSGRKGRTVRRRRRVPRAANISAEAPKSAKGSEAPTEEAEPEPELETAGADDAPVFRRAAEG